jgi:sugar/nucleoside kinase (ribokinase family)
MHSSRRLSRGSRRGFHFSPAVRKDNMSEHKPKVVGVGNALVDILVSVDDAVIERNNLDKGGMALVSEAAIQSLYEGVGPSTENSGGSVANTIAHLAMNGVATGYVGKVADDTFGRIFDHDLASLGVDTRLRQATNGDGTGRCLVMITPDGQRTMSTYLGAAVSIDGEDVSVSVPDACDVILIEGYLWDAPEGAAVIDAVIARAKAAGARIAVTLSDAGCVQRHLDPMREFVEQHCDILLANEAEACALARETDVDAAMDQIRQTVALAAVTHSERGSTVLQGDLRASVAPHSVDRVVDTTGAGDAYAAGFLRAHLEGASPTECGSEGGRLAARVIQHIGARLSPAPQARAS